MHCIWLGCIKSWTEDPSHRFLTNIWLVHSRFVGLNNSLKAVVHHLLIRGMTGLSYWDEFLMVNILVCMVTHWTWLMMSHDLRLSSNHDLTKLLHCVVFQPWENIEFVLKLLEAFTYWWDCKLIIYFQWIESLLMKANNNRYSQ